MIHRARFQNYKALKAVEITFDSRLTVLVGPNGSGKTSVLRGIYWLCQLATGNNLSQQTASQIVQGLNTTYSGPTGEQFFELLDMTSGAETGIRFRTHPKERFNPGIPGSSSQDTSMTTLVREGQSKNWLPGSAMPFPGPLAFCPAEYIALNASKLAAPSNTTATPPPMQTDGSGLASLLGYFKYFDEPRFDQAVELFQKVIPQVTRIRMDRVAIGGGTLGEGLVFDMPNRRGVTASSMSDGTLYILGLIVKILDPQRPKTLLIDDIDHGFHPKAQLTIVELLHKLLEEIPDLQIIATSHSPYILDRLEWNEVRVTSLDDDGSAVVARLDDHPDFERWKDAMTPGEFWSTFYEDWATKLKPAAQFAP
jgi:predicted ATPase